MNSSELLHINARHGTGKPERLFRAAVSAFCSLTRPSRNEIAQLDDLALPLFPMVSEDALRYVAAALSESPYAPGALVRRLSDQPVEISAPLLVRSPILTNIDLIALIGRHGIAHARAIARRADLDPRIQRLTAVLLARDILPAPPLEIEAEPTATTPQDATPDTSIDILENASHAEEQARMRLRGMMRPAGQAHTSAPEGAIQLRWDGNPGIYRKLRSTALTDVPVLFHTALADALAVDLHQAQSIVGSADVSELIVALRSLSLSVEEAFLIAMSTAPARFPHSRAIAAFLDAYEALSPEDAALAARQWQAGTARAETDNSDFDRIHRYSEDAANEAVPARRFKAS